MSELEVITGTIDGPQKVVIYGPEGIGKSTLASRFPNSIFSDTEGSTKKLNVARLKAPSSWTMLMNQVARVKVNPYKWDTYILDTADWAERLCTEHICAVANKTGIEDFGYGKGTVYLAEEFGRLINSLDDLINLGMNVVIVAHAMMRKFEQPEENGSYDRWELKLSKYVRPMLMEWADMVLFCNFKTHVYNVDGQGVHKGKNKTQDAGRVIHTVHHPCWDAKNRHDLLPEIPMDWDEIKHCFTPRANKPAATTPPPTAPAAANRSQPPTPPPAPTEPAAPSKIPEIIEPPDQKTIDWNDLGQEIKSQAQLDQIRREREQTAAPVIPDSVPRGLADLMKHNNVTLQEIQRAVLKRGYYPENTPFEKYDPGFVDGVLIGAWDKVYGLIEEIRVDDEIPF